VIKQLNIHDFLQQSAGYLTIDVRSEGEYNYGHIPHASSFPLFNNEERAKVGTLYKQKGKDVAIMEGLDIVGKKMKDYAESIRAQVNNNKVFVHCWRGGMRSGSVATLLNIFGYEVYVLNGGYKAYRNYVLDEFAKPYKFLVLGGRTGSGKTQILQALKAQGEQVIDLEALANHKGSAFGALGENAQPKSEHFENLLHKELVQLDNSKTIWLEDESKSIGSCYLPLALWQQMKQAPLYVIEIPFEVRVKKLVQQYGQFDIAGIKEAVDKIYKRLGGQNWKEAIEALERKDAEAVTNIVLRYYDKAYDHQIATKETKEIYRLVFESENDNEIASALIKAKK
jgi:tRNA 2-selenouridine synthase